MILSTNFAGKLSAQVYIFQITLQHSLSEIIGNKGDQYVAVLDPTCCGKSTIVKHIIAAYPVGVIPISMSSDFKDLFNDISVFLKSSENHWQAYLTTLYSWLANRQDFLPTGFQLL
jgi:hypothetical protein